MSLFDEFSTYERDKPLLAKLGLQPFKGKPHHRLYVGEVNDPRRVKIWVDGMPAQFWHFEITDETDRVVEVDTGSGSLSEYWPMVEAVRDGMFVVKGITLGRSA